MRWQAIPRVYLSKKALSKVALSIIALSFVGCVQSKRVTFLEVPSEQTIVPLPEVDLASYEERFGEYDGVYLLYERTIEHSGSKDGTAKLLIGFGSTWRFDVIHREQYLIFNTEDEDLASFRIGFKPDHFYIRLRNPSGEVRSFDSDDFREEKDSDGSKDYAIVFPDIVSGTLVDIGYDWGISTSSYPPPLRYDIPLQFTIPCDSISVSFAYPDWWEIQVKQLSASGKLSLGGDSHFEEKKNVITYTRSNIPALRREPFSPSFKEMAQYFQFEVMKLEMLGGKLEKSETWEDLAKQIRKNVLKDKGKDRKKVNKLSDSLTNGLETDQEKIASIVRHVQDNFDITDDWQDGKIGKILKHKKGSAIDLSALAQALLYSAGIDAEVALLHSAEGGYFDESYVSSSQFLIPGVWAQTSDKGVLLLPHVKQLPVNHTPDYLAGQWALLLSKSTPGTITKIPENTSTNNQINSEHTVTINDNGTVEVHEKFSFGGAYAYSWRSRTAELKYEELKATLKTLASFADVIPELDTLQLSGVDDIDGYLEVDLRYTIPDAAVITAEEVLFNPEQLFFPGLPTGLRKKAEDRENPIRIHYNMALNRTVNLIYPENWTLGVDISNQTIENSFGSLAITAQNDLGHLSLGVVVNVEKTFRGKKEFPDLRTLTGVDGVCPESISFIILGS